MSEPILSFCIPVYNQTDLVEKLVCQILSYNGNDIEVVISDDCSTENIYEMLVKIGDSRVKYFRNEKNLGHDLNIVTSFRKARGEYGFLLRARDGVVVKNIERIIEVIRKEGPISYITGEAIDENNKFRIKYAESKLIIDREDCLRLHYSLYVHPSGSIYNIRMLDLDRIEYFIKKNIDTKYSFIVHNLFRVYLSRQGRFYVLDIPTWIYTDTSKAKDIAVNKGQNGASVYSSELIMRRYIAELRWIFDILEDGMEELQISIISVFRTYIYQITWGQKRRNSNRGIINHYQINPVNSSVKNDTDEMLKITSRIMTEYGIMEKIVSNIEKCLKRATFKNIILGGIKYAGACLLDFVHIKWIYDLWRKNREIKF